MAQELSTTIILPENLYLATNTSDSLPSDQTVKTNNCEQAQDYGNQPSSQYSQATGWWRGWAQSEEKAHRTELQESSPVEKLILSNHMAYKTQEKYKVMRRMEICCHQLERELYSQAKEPTQISHHLDSLSELVASNL